MLVDEDVELPSGVIDDVFQPLEHRRRSVPDFFQNCLKNNHVVETVALCDDVDFIQDDVGILFMREKRL
jgi:hypothetical protein